MISAIIPSYNENPSRLATTVDSMWESCDEELEIIVVDDGSDSPVELSRPYVNVVRNSPGIGAMQSINKGLGIATGDFLFSCDSHMRFTERHTLERLKGKAENERCITFAPSTGYEDGSNKYLDGVYLHWNRREGIQARWRHEDRPKDWTRVPAMMGADYMMSRETMEYLKDLTGNVWDNIAGRWGFGEESMGLKCFLSNIPIYMSPDHDVHHFYHSRNPLNESQTADAHKERWKNVVYTLSGYLDRLTYKERFLPIVKRHLPKKAPERVATEMDVDWERDVGEIFTHLLGYKSRVSSIHPDYQWMEGALERCRELQPEKILVWRPNEVVFRLHREFPDADIRVIEYSKRRLNTWKFIIPELEGVSLKKAQYHNFPEIPDMEGWRGFDAAFICGTHKSACKEMCSDIVDGPVFTSPTDFSSRMEHGDRKAEQELIRKQSNRDERDVVDEWWEKINPTRVAVIGDSPIEGERLTESREYDIIVIGQGRFDMSKIKDNLSNAGIVVLDRHPWTDTENFGLVDSSPNGSIKILRTFS